MIKESLRSLIQEKTGSSSSSSSPRINMVRFSPDWDNETKTPEPEEPKTPEGPKAPEPERPKTPEPEPMTDYSASQQKIFEEIHEKLVYDTVEEKDHVISVSSAFRKSRSGQTSS